MSTNELLVTHKEPYQEHNAADLLSNFEQPTTFYYSSLAIGCNAADGKGADPSGNSDDPDKVVEAIFTPFRNSCVTKVNSTSCMTYWGNYNQLDPNDPNCSGIHGLLDNEDAHCGEWAAFFQDMLKLQGIITGKPHLVTYQIKDGDIGYLDALTTAKLNNATHTFFENKEDNVGWQTIGGDYVAYFFVKEYNFQPFNANGENFYLYKQEPRPAPPTTPEQFVITTQSGNKTLKEANQYGIEGQGHVKDPNSVFFNHVIVSYKQKNETVGFLDPSYGTPASGYYSDENAYETESFSGFGAYGLYVEGSIEKMIIWINALNDNNPQLHFTP